LIRKLLAGVSIAAVAVVALLLVTINGGTAKPAEADVASISTTTTVVGVDIFAQLHVVAEDDIFCNPNCDTDQVIVTATAGDFVWFDPTGFVSGCYDDFFQSCAFNLDSNGFNSDGLDGQCDDDLFGPGDTQIAIQTVTCDGQNFNTTELEIWWQAPPGFAGGTVTFTAEQGGVFKTSTITVLGAPATIELHAFRHDSTETAECQDTDVFVIAAEEYTFNNPTSFNNNRAILCAEVRDSNGSLLSGINVIWSTSDGSLGAPVTISNPLATNQLTSGTTGNSGDIATVTATAGSATASVKVQFGGDPASCSIPDIDVLDIGDTAHVVATFLDSKGNWVPDGIIAHLEEVDSGDGADNVDFVSVTEDTVKGVVEGDIIGAIAGLTTVAASVERIAGADVVCSEAIELTGDVHIHPDACPEDPDFILFGNKPPAGGGFGTFAFCGGSFEALLKASGCPAATSAFFYNKPNGTFAVWIPGSEVAAVNAEIFTIFPNEHMPIPHGTIFTAKCK
jgi:hypothetical protein